MMFASAFYLYLGPRKSDEFGFHDDGAPSAFGTFPYTIYNLILLGPRARCPSVGNSTPSTRPVRAGFVGEFDPDNFDEVAVRVLLVFFILVVMIVCCPRRNYALCAIDATRRPHRSSSTS